MFLKTYPRCNVGQLRLFYLSHDAHPQIAGIPHDHGCLSVRVALKLYIAVVSLFFVQVLYCLFEETKS